MERVIDRKEYRRNNENTNIISDEQIDIVQKRLKKFLFQSLGASLIFLIISFLKFYNCIDILEKINFHLDSEITVSSLQKSGQRIFEEASKYYNQLNILVENILKEDYAINNNVFNLSGDNSYVNNVIDNKNISSLVNVINSGEVLNYSGEFVNTNRDKNATNTDNLLVNNYMTAVEGINQMSEDAEYINENYEMTIPVIGTITSEFGVRNSTNPIVSHYHSGLDIAANSGTQILAALDGEVIEAATDTYYGKYLKIQKDNIVMIYAHCSKLLVKKGDKVKKGSLIAYVGNTGNSTGPHLHFEVKYDDRLVNPSDILDL